MDKRVGWLGRCPGWQPIRGAKISLEKQKYGAKKLKCPHAKEFL
jgi:hypothetical protein